MPQFLKKITSCHNSKNCKVIKLVYKFSSKNDKTIIIVREFKQSPSQKQVDLLRKGLPGGSDGKESACNVEGLGSVLGLGRSPGGGHATPLWYSCLENPHGQRSRWAMVHGVAKSETRLSTHRVRKTLTRI